MRGVVLAGGHATRLAPTSLGVSKQLMPVYDKPMIYYPIGTLVSLGCTEIVIVCKPIDLVALSSVVDTLPHIDTWMNGAAGIKFSFVVQHVPSGIADGLRHAEIMVGGDGHEEDFWFILGDNIFTGLAHEAPLPGGAVMYGKWVPDAHRYGVADFDSDGRCHRIIEKPVPGVGSDIAITGLYRYDHTVWERITKLTKSARGEYEITDLNNSYLLEGNATVYELDESVDWFDAGTPDALLEVSNFVAAVQKRRGQRIGWEGVAP